MKRLQFTLLVIGAVITAGLILGIAVPKASADVRAALVEIVMPRKPFFSLIPAPDTGTFPFIVHSVGPGSAGTLAISNITIVNPNSNNSAGVSIYSGLAGADSTNCGQASLGGDPLLIVIVPPDSTFTIPYPTPLIIAPSSGKSCVTYFSGFGPGTNVNVYVTGFVN